MFQFYTFNDRLWFAVDNFSTLLEFECYSNGSSCQLLHVKVRSEIGSSQKIEPETTKSRVRTRLGVNYQLHEVWLSNDPAIYPLALEFENVPPLLI